MTRYHMGQIVTRAPTPSTTRSREWDKLFNGAKPTQAGVWSWLPKWVAVDILEQAMKACKTALTPPDGDAFMQDGIPYAFPADYAEQMCEEFRMLVQLRLGVRGTDGLLSDPDEAYRSVKRAAP